MEQINSESTMLEYDETYDNIIYKLKSFINPTSDELSFIETLDDNKKMNIILLYHEVTGIFIEHIKNS